VVLWLIDRKRESRRGRRRHRFGCHAPDGHAGIRDHRPVLATTVIRVKQHENLVGRPCLIGYPGRGRSLEMKLLRDVVDWVRSGVGAIWRAVAPHAGPGVAGGVAAQIIRTRRELVLENAMLRHQVVILRRKSPRPRLTTFDRLRLLVAAAVLRTWRRTLAIVQPETVLRWHREGFCMFWRRRSRSKSAERRVAAETIALIREMATKNRLWGAERIRGELVKLGIKV
jgi:hypothetical protein